MSIRASFSISGVITFIIELILDDITEIGPSILSITFFIVFIVSDISFITPRGIPTPATADGIGRAFKTVIMVFNAGSTNPKVVASLSKVSRGF